MRKTITILFIFLLLLVTPVYAGSSFQYSRLINTDNLMGYKSVVLDKSVYDHSNRLNDLRVINNKGEEVPYLLVSISDATTATEKESFTLSEVAQYSSIQDGTDSIITIQLNHLNPFRLELSTDDIIERTYGLFGVKDVSTYYLSDGELFTHLPSDPSISKHIEWTNAPSIDKLRLIIHNRDAKPITLEAINVKYYLTKLLYQDLGNSDYRLAYGNDTLRSPIYKALNYKAIVKNENIARTDLGAEVNTPSQADTSQSSTSYKLLLNSTLAALVLLLLLGFGIRLSKKKKNNKYRELG